MPSQNPVLVHTHSQHKRQKKRLPCLYYRRSLCLLKEKHHFVPWNTRQRKALGTRCNHKGAWMLKASGTRRRGRPSKVFSRAGYSISPGKPRLAPCLKNKVSPLVKTSESQPNFARRCLLKPLLPRLLRPTCSLGKPPSPVSLCSLSALSK